MQKILRSPSFPGAILALFAFAVYWTTLSPSVDVEDCGEIASALYTLGIVHPTGYPLFTLLGWCFSHLPLGGTPIWRLNLMVSLLCALSVFLFYRLFLFLLSEDARRLFRTRAVPQAGKRAPVSTDAGSSASASVLDRTAAALAALVLAFSRTFWSESVSVEVYAFHLVFLSGVTLLFLRALAGHGRHDSGVDWGWLGFALALGLSFANHMMTVLLAPAFLYLYFAQLGFGRAAWAKIGRAVILFLAGLSVYAYLPLRAARNPAVDWGDPSTPERFWWHVSTRIYHYKMFISPDVPVRKLGDFLKAFPSEFAYAPLLLAAAGLWVLYRRSPRLLAFSLLIAAGCLFYTLNYDFDDPNFYLNAYAAVAVWILFGIRFLLERGGGYRLPAMALCGAAALCPLGLNYRAADRSGDYVLADYSRNILESVEPGGILLTSQYQNFTAPANYLQLGEGVRPDVVIVDTQLLKFPWYYKQLERRYPWLVRDARPEIDAFLRANDVYEHAGAQDSAAFVQAALPEYAAVIRRLLREDSTGHPVYVTVEIPPGTVSGFRKVPSGMAFRLYRGETAPPVPPRVFSFRPFPRKNPMTDVVKTYYAIGYFNQGVYGAIVLKDTATGIVLLRKALEVDPGFPNALQWLGRLEPRRGVFPAGG